MGRNHFDQVSEAAKKLSRKDKRRLLDLLEGWLASRKKPMTEEEFEQELAREGIVTLPRRGKREAGYLSWKPIKIKGKPLSETIIEERR